MKMMISKSQGEKLANSNMNSVYGGLGCGGICGNCDCRKSEGDLFFGAFDSSMTDYDNVLQN